MKKTGKILLNIFTGAILFNLLWYIAAARLRIPVLVDPIVVYSSLGDVWKQSMSTHLTASLWRIICGISVSALVGLIIALLMLEFKTFGKLMNSFIYFVYPIPKLALLPIVMLLAGLGDLTKIIMIVLIIVFQIIINLRDGMKQIPKENFYVAISLGASKLQILKNIIMPALLPDLLSTLRVAIGTAISVLFVTETYGTEKGMGFFIVDAWMRINYIEMYAGIVILSAMGFVLFVLTDLLEITFCKWKEK